MEKKSIFGWLSILWLPLVMLISEGCFALLAGNPLSYYTGVLVLSMALFVTALILLVPKKKFRVIAFGVITHLLTIVYISQYIYFKIFGTIFVWASISSGGAGAVAEYNNVVRDAMLHGWWGILILILPSALYWPVIRRFIKEIPEPGRKQLIAASAAFAAITLLGTLQVLADRKGASSPRRLYLSEFSQDASLRTFGLAPTMALDFRMNVLDLKWDEKINVDVSDIVIETRAPDTTTIAPTATPIPTPEPTRAPDATPTPTPAPTPTPTPYPKNVLDIDFDLEEDNKTYRNMNEFFSQREPTSMNE